jgi:hypothetical protein
MVMKVTDKELLEYYNKKGSVFKVIDEDWAILKLDNGAQIKIHKSKLNTVVPNLSRKVIILKYDSEHHHQLAVLKSHDIPNKIAEVSLVSDSSVVLTLPFNQFTKAAKQ